MGRPPSDRRLARRHSPSSVTVTLKGGIAVLVTGKSASPGASSVGASATVQLKQGSTVLDDDVQYAASDGLGGAVMNSSSLLAIFTPPSDGSYTFSVNSVSFTKKTVAVMRTYKG